MVICKNRRLSHQYQKLQQSAHAGGELPAPPSFVDDDDEDEDEVSKQTAWKQVQFTGGYPNRSMLVAIKVDLY